MRHGVVGRGGRASTLLRTGVAVLLLGVLLAAAGCSGGSDRAATSSTAATPSTGTSISDRPAARVTHRSAGRSAEARPIDVYSAGSGAVRVLVIGGIHGDEFGAEVARALVGYLQGHPGAMGDGLALDIIPSANPDGEAAGTRGNAEGVDLNRNFPAENWSASLNSGDAPSKGLTGGSSPGSEPETQVLLAVLDRGYDLVVSLHSEGGIIDHDGPGGEAIAERYSALCGLPVQHVAYQSQVTGSLGTFVPERYGIPVLTIELDSPELTPGLRKALLTGAAPAAATSG